MKASTFWLIACAICLLVAFLGSSNWWLGAFFCLWRCDVATTEEQLKEIKERLPK